MKWVMSKCSVIEWWDMSMRNEIDSWTKRIIKIIWMMMMTMIVFFWIINSTVECNSVPLYQQRRLNIENGSESSFPPFLCKCFSEFMFGIYIVALSFISSLSFFIIILYFIGYFEYLQHEKKTHTQFVFIMSGSW